MGMFQDTSMDERGAMKNEKALRMYYEGDLILQQLKEYLRVVHDWLSMGDDVQDDMDDVEKAISYRENELYYSWIKMEGKPIEQRQITKEK